MKKNGNELEKILWESGKNELKTKLRENQNQKLY